MNRRALMQLIGAKEAIIPPEEVLLFQSDSPRTIKTSWGQPNDVRIYYSIDEGATWHYLQPYTETKASDKIYMFGTSKSSSGITSADDAYAGWEFSGSSSNKLKVYGDLMSLVLNENYTKKTTISTYGAFRYMFQNCTALRVAPSISATSIQETQVFVGMYDGCSNLTTVPAFAENISMDYRDVNSIADSMFNNCTSLTSVPDIPFGGYFMFSGCTNLTEINITCPYEISNIIGNASAYPSWTGKIYKYFYPVIENNWGGWEVEYVFEKEVTDYLTYECDLDASYRLKDSKSRLDYGSWDYHCFFYSVDDGETWTPWNSGNENPYLSQNETPMTKKLLVFGMTLDDNNEMLRSGFYFPRIVNHTVDQNPSNPEPYDVHVTGDIMSLMLKGNQTKRTTAQQFSFYFAWATGNFFGNLKTAPTLSATTLTNSCYIDMFRGCTKLTTAPELPATTLASNCYNGMFSGCSNLLVAPILHATNVADACYENMFQNCYSLTEIKLAYTGTSREYTANWVYGISSSGTLYKAGTQYASDGDDSYPSTWTQVLWTP